MDIIKEFHKQKLVIIGMAIVGIVSTIMPWASINVWGIRSRVNGLAGGDGWIVILAMGVVIAIAMVGERKNKIDLNDPKFKWGLVGAGVVTGLIGIINFLQLTGVPFTSIGLGLFLAIVVGAAIAVVGFKPEFLDNVISKIDNIQKNTTE